MTKSLAIVVAVSLAVTVAVATQHFVHFRQVRPQHVDKKLHNYGLPDKRSDQLNRKCCL